MGYCTYKEVQGEFKEITLSTTSTITIADCNRFIAETSALIDAKVGLRFITPVTGASALIILRSLCVQLVANRMKRILAVKSGEENTEQKESESDDTLLMKKLDDIAEGNMLLPDATRLSTGGIRSYTHTNDYEPVMQRDVDQW